jgi:hypothetical protein
VEDAGSLLRGARAAPVNKRRAHGRLGASSRWTQGRLRIGRPFCAP